MSTKRRLGRLLWLVYLALGLGLLAAVLSRVDVDAVVEQVASVGVAGVAVVLALYLVAFLIDSLTWLMALPDLPITPRWLYRMFRVRMAGPAKHPLIKWSE